MYHVRQLICIDSRFDSHSLQIDAEDGVSCLEIGRPDIENAIQSTWT